MPISVRTTNGAITLELSYRVLRIGEVVTVYETPVIPPPTVSFGYEVNGAPINQYAINWPPAAYRAPPSSSSSNVGGMLINNQTINYPPAVYKTESTTPPGLGGSLNSNTMNG